jgi:hypothetical protein
VYRTHAARVRGAPGPSCTSTRSRRGKASGVGCQLAGSWDPPEARCKAARPKAR